jgi:hypothetical protein
MPYCSAVGLEVALREHAPRVKVRKQKNKRENVFLTISQPPLLISFKVDMLRLYRS